MLELKKPKPLQICIEGKWPVFILLSIPFYSGVKSEKCPQTTEFCIPAVKLLLRTSVLSLSAKVMQKPSSCHTSVPHHHAAVPPMRCPGSWDPCGIGFWGTHKLCSVADSLLRNLHISGELLGLTRLLVTDWTGVDWGFPSSQEARECAI